MKKIVGIMLASLMLFTSCMSTTLVTLDARDNNTSIILDGKDIGKSPVQKRISNALWENPDIILVDENGNETYAELEKELKGVNLVFGLFLWWPSLLYSYGPDEYQILR